MAPRSSSVAARMVTPPIRGRSSGGCTVFRQRSSPEKEQTAEEKEVESEMPGEAQVLAGVTETSATDIEASRLRDDSSGNENGHQHGENQNAAAIQHAGDQGEPAKDFQPGQIKRQPDADRPGQCFVVINISREPNRVQDLDYARVNEQPADDERHHPPKETGGDPRLSQLDVGRWTLDVGRFHHGFSFFHASHPPSRTKTLVRPASLRKRCAISRLEPQPSLLQ